jgi:hypothetical protein
MQVFAYQFPKVVEVFLMLTLTMVSKHRKIVTYQSDSLMSKDKKLNHFHKPKISLV